jgi:hypothetical protein
MQVIPPRASHFTPHFRVQKGTQAPAFGSRKGAVRQSQRAIRQRIENVICLMNRQTVGISSHFPTLKNDSLARRNESQMLFFL